MERSEKRYEEYAYVLDYLPHGRAGTRPGYRAGALIQVVGEEYFTFLEAVARESVILKTSDRVYVGKDSRRKITYIIGRINYNDLTSNAKMELSGTVEKIVINREKWFINFFNTAQAIGVLFDFTKEVNSLLNAGQPLSQDTLTAINDLYQTLGEDVLGLIPQDLTVEAGGDLVNGVFDVLIQIRQEARAKNTTHLQLVQEAALMQHRIMVFPCLGLRSL